MLLAAGLAFAVQVLGPRESRLVAFGFVLATGVVALAMLVSVRCPRCRRSLGVWALKAGGVTTWQDALAGLEVCPYCKSSPDRSDSGQ